jgi:hypothetical protein
MQFINFDVFFRSLQFIMCKNQLFRLLHKANEKLSCCINYAAGFRSNKSAGYQSGAQVGMADREERK